MNSYKVSELQASSVLFFCRQTTPSLILLLLNRRYRPVREGPSKRLDGQSTSPMKNENAAGVQLGEEKAEERPYSSLFFFFF